MSKKLLSGFFVSCLLAGHSLWAAEESLPPDGQEVKFGPENVQQNGWREPCEFRNLRWEGGVQKTDATAAVTMTDAVPQNLDETIRKEIEKSIALEKAERGMRK